MVALFHCLKCFLYQYYTEFWRPECPDALANDLKCPRYILRHIDQFHFGCFYPTLEFNLEFIHKTSCDKVNSRKIYYDLHLAWIFDIVIEIICQRSWHQVLIQYFCDIKCFHGDLLLYIIDICRPNDHLWQENLSEEYTASLKTVLICSKFRLPHRPWTDTECVKAYWVQVSFCVLYGYVFICFL